MSPVSLFSTKAVDQAKRYFLLMLMVRHGR